MIASWAPPYSLLGEAALQPRFSRAYDASGNEFKCFEG